MFYYLYTWHAWCLWLLVHSTETEEKACSAIVSFIMSFHWLLVLLYHSWFSRLLDIFLQIKYNWSLVKFSVDNKGSASTENSGNKLESMHKSPPATPAFKKRHRGCSFCILDIVNAPIPEFPSNEEVVGVITMEDVIEELLKVNLRLKYIMAMCSSESVWTDHLIDINTAFWTSI